jgi:group I intron endonuclease
MERSGCIYKITNLENDKVYIGQTIQPVTRRWSQHRQYAKSGKKMVLYDAIRKYGIDKFKFEILFDNLNIDELNKKEIENINKYNSLVPDGYNAGKGGDNYERTIETREKISNIHKGRVITDEWKRKMSESQKGKKHTEESKKKMSESQKGRKQSEETKQKLSKINLGKKLSPERIQKIIDGQTGKKRSEKAKINMRGRKCSEETKKLISESQKGKIISEETKNRISSAKKNIRRISNDIIKEIQENKENLKQTELSKKYNLSRNTICRIVNHKDGY